MGIIRLTLIRLGYGLSLLLSVIGANSLRFAMGIGFENYYLAAAGGLIGFAQGTGKEGFLIFEEYRGHPGIFVPTFLYWDGSDIAIAFYIPVLLLLVLTYILHRSWRPPENHCPCGYDLTGNVSGLCPECGHTVRSSNPSIRY